MAKGAPCADGDFGAVGAFFQQAEFKINAGIEAFSIFIDVGDFGALAQRDGEWIGELDTEPAMHVWIEC